MTSHLTPRVAVIGAGMSGATCAQALTQAGHAVQVFDKARGPGGRLATRRMAWDEAGRRSWTTRMDHGALGITARSPAFLSFVHRGVQAGWLARWSPVMAPGSRALEPTLRFHLPTPDLPTVCRQLLEGSVTRCGAAVQALRRGADGWQLQVDDTWLPDRFDAVVLAIPPAQAAPLLAPHRADWSADAAQVTMQPCWTLMGIEAVDVLNEPFRSSRPWDLAAPVDGPLAWVLRQDARPGRPAVAGQAHWVAHARIDWSREHLERSPVWIQAHLLDALDAVIGRRAGQTLWHHSVVHRWRYALPPQRSCAPAASTSPCWWDAERRLGVCGDFLGAEGMEASGDGPGSHGVEAAWWSGRALAAQVLAQRLPQQLSHQQAPDSAFAEALT
ncbi:NAD(P)/FAD-dependent oxidoreductase [Leptothrix sp. BB-4]